jgi:hypothetical protein
MEGLFGGPLRFLVQNRAMANTTSDVDHILLGAPTLEEGIGWLEHRTSVRASPGGVHPGLGTWNALASLGSGCYLEIIAADPGQTDVATFYVPRLRELSAPKVVRWAARSKAVESRFAAFRSGGLVCDEIKKGSRVRADGGRLGWSLAFPRHERHDNFDGALPFLIEWDADSPHPSSTAVPGLRLAGFSVLHPLRLELEACLHSLDLNVAVAMSATSTLRLEVETPRGRVVLE